MQREMHRKMQGKVRKCGRYKREGKEIKKGN
jgi:hypothetical protein